MPKVLHVITGLGVGGAESMLARLVARSDRARMPSLVVSLTPAETPAELAATGVPVFSLNMRPGSPDPRGVRRLARIIAREQPDVVQTWMYHADFVGLLASRWAHRGALAWNLRTASLNQEESSRSVLALRWALARLSAVPDAIVANSQSGREFHEAAGYHPRRWAIIPNGFDTGALRPDPEWRARTRAQLAIADDVPVIGMVARYGAIKDHRTFFEAAAHLTATDSRTVFVLAGLRVDSSNPEIESFMNRLHLDRGRFRLLGNRDRIPELLPALDVATLSSSSEGFPNALGEAMAAGVPCVGTDAGDTARLIGETGVVVPIKSPAALADGWRRLLLMPSSERAALGRAARARIEQYFSIDHVVSMYAELYGSLAETTRRR